MKRHSFSILLLFAGLVISSLFAQPIEEVKPSDVGMKDVIPVDPDITLGKFENGVNY